MYTPHTRTYAQGLSEAQVKEVVDKKIKEMDLAEYAGRSAATYSGGNKRKLSVAMAMIGKPLIVFLDGACVRLGMADRPTYSIETSS